MMNAGPREEVFETGIEGFVLRGHWHHSSTTSRRGLVLVHGASGYCIGPHRLFVSFARLAANRAWHVLRFDLSGRGHSDGAPLTTSLDDMIRDTAAACRAFQKVAALEQQALVGLCSGAVVALSVARAQGVNRLVLWSPEPPSPQPNASWARLHVFCHRLAGYARKALDLGTWRRLVDGQVDVRSVRKVLTESLGARAPAGSVKLRSETALREAQDELRRRGSCDEPCAPMLLVFPRHDPLASNTCNYFKERLQSTSRPHEILWIERTTHNFFSVEAHQELFAHTIRFLNQ